MSPKYECYLRSLKNSRVLVLSKFHEKPDYILIIYTTISIKVVREQSGKVEYERERLLGIANKLMNFQRDSQQPFALIFDFSALLVDNLN